jgi:riboflavin transporter FmnP
MFKIGVFYLFLLLLPTQSFSFVIKKGENEMKTVSNSMVNANEKKVKVLSTRGITTIALLAVIATILMLFEIPLWFAPNFYKIDLSELPVLVGAFALGPVAGIFIELIKILLNLILNGTDTALVGEISNFILGCSLVVPSAIIYKIGKSRKSAIIGMIIGSITFIAFGSLLNAYVLLPTYAKIYGMPIESLVAMGTAINPRITSLTDFILWAVAPFNLIKATVVSFITAFIYKDVSHMIKEFHITRRQVQK